MKNTLNNLFLAVFLALITQGIQAQFDDLYFDPDQDSGKKEYYRDNDRDSYKKNDLEEDFYDDDYREWEDQDYYYSSRIKRFHRPYRGFDYFHGCYIDYVFYDPYDFNPWYFSGNIYSSHYGYRDYYNWRRWHHQPYHSYSYWNHWDWCWGWSSYPVTFHYHYWPGNYYSGYYYNYGRYNYYYHPYQGGGYHNNNDRHPNGTYYGSRNLGLTNSSNKGPVRIVTPPARKFKEADGTQNTPAPGQGNAKRIVQSVDGDRYNPTSDVTPDKKPRRQEATGYETTPSPEPQKRSNRASAKESIEKPYEPVDIKPAPKREYKSSFPERNASEKEEFRPNRLRRDQLRDEPSRESNPRIEIPRERSKDSYQAPREYRPEPRNEPREFQSAPSRSHSEPSGSRSSGNSNRDGSSQRRPPR
jgi:hypothetical protein